MRHADVLWGDLNPNQKQQPRSEYGTTFATSGTLRQSTAAIEYGLVNDA